MGVDIIKAVMLTRKTLKTKDEFSLHYCWKPDLIALEFLLDSVSVFCLIIFFQVGLEESSNTRMGWLSYYFYLRLDHMCIIVVVFGYSK